MIRHDIIGVRKEKVILIALGFIITLLFLGVILLLINHIIK